MDFLNKLFGNPANMKNKTRAQFKDEKYFTAQVERANRFMQADKDNDREYLKKHDRLTAFHHISSATIRNQQVENLYSRGDLIETLVPVYLESLAAFLQGWSEDYENYALLLQMTSFAVLLDIPADKKAQLVAFMEKAFDSKVEEVWKPDSLIFSLLGNDDRRRAGDEPYEALYQITRLPATEIIPRLKLYLDDWYNMHKADPWYNTHLREKGYSGYWAWEVAAVVKLLQLDDSSLRDNQFYPYDMVHRKEKNK